MTAPIAPLHPITRSFHGREFVDNYEWMRDKTSLETLAFLEGENAYTEEKTADQEQLRQEIFHEISSRVKQTDMSVPMRFGQYWYYSRTEEGKNYPYSCRIPLNDAADWMPPTIPASSEEAENEQILLDFNELAEGHEFFSVGASSVTTSGKLLAYSVDYAGDERFELRIKNLETGEHLEDTLSNLFYGATWIGEKYLFYITVDEAWRPDTVWRHTVGTPQAEDVRVFYEPDARFTVDVDTTSSEEFLCVSSNSKITSEEWVLSTQNPEGELRVLWEREDGVEYSTTHAVVDGQDKWVVTHNALGPNFSVGFCVVDEELPPLRNLTPLVQHDDSTRVFGVDTYRDFMVLGYRRDGIARAALMSLNQGFAQWSEVAFPEELYTAVITGAAEWSSPVVRLSYSSFLQPTQVFQLEVATGERTFLKEQEVLGGYNPADYTAYRLWATASDGEKIPISVVHRADLDTTQPRPMLLYGYGAYESSTDPEFSVARLSLMDRGMIFAVAHVRGGGEKGRRWYDEGKKLAKKNTFTDFIACADYLIDTQLTAPDRLVGEGGSAGGLLIGAVANMAPDRFTAIQAIVPFVDPLTSILKPELPLTVTEWDEWGDPYHDSEVYDYMASYSPYENVTAQDYPDILAVTSINDTRVLYVEPAKWIAHLQATARSGEFLLKTEMSAGHGGVSGRYKQWEQTAFEYAWTLTKATSI